MMRDIWTALLAAAAALTRGAAAATPGANCSRIVRVGTFDDGAPYVLAPATRWLDGGGACFAYYRQPSGARALELLGRGDLDLAFMGSMPWARAVARGVGVTAVSFLMDLDNSEGLVVDSTITRLQDLRKKTLAAPFARADGHAHRALALAHVARVAAVDGSTAAGRVPPTISSSIWRWRRGELSGVGTHRRDHPRPPVPII